MDDREYERMNDYEEESEKEESEYDEEYDDELSDEEESKTTEPVEMAPVDIFKRIKFLLNKENHKDKYIYFPVPIKKIFTKYVMLGIACFALAIMISVLYRTPLMSICPLIIMFACIFFAYRTYLYGTCKQYIEIKGNVVKSDYAENQAQYYRAAAKRMTRADFDYRSFTLMQEDGDDRRIVVNCKTYKDLPREGDKVCVCLDMQTYVDELPNEVVIREYIGITKIVA